MVAPSKKSNDDMPWIWSFVDRHLRGLTTVHEGTPPDVRRLLAWFWRYAVAFAVIVLCIVYDVPHLMWSSLVSLARAP